MSSRVLPLPVWRTPFQGGTFAQAAVTGFVLPFAAAAWPVWRAVRVQPVQAIRVGHLAARGNGLAPLLRWLRLPGRGYRQIPLRNVLRTPRRSALTLLGIAAAIATLVTIVGLLDTFRATLDTASAGLLRAAPARVTVSLDSYYPAAVAAGYGLLAWLTATTIASVMPEIGVTAALSAGTVAGAVLLGTAAVAAAPLFTLRKLRRTDIPATLRVVE